MKEVLDNFELEILSSDVVFKLGLEPRKYLVVSAHREENIDLKNNFEVLSEALNGVAEEYKMPIIFSTHPRTKKRIQERGIVFHELIRNVEPLGFFDYVKLQKEAFVVLSDSGTISEESAMMNFPAVSIRTSTERPEAIDAGTIVLGGISKESMLQSIPIARGLNESGQQHLPFEYEVRNCSTRVIRVIQSYTSIVNRVTWNKI
ncbi:UDP-N-acetylglucosamine 2-epimerase [Algoriphagus halophilus]|uniref:UDP-N-acetylglucosamine 2-epimerase n=1 Tax=Algoriphagus halophilus TaxID=226505 RepID=UPI00358F5C7C